MGNNSQVVRRSSGQYPVLVRALWFIFVGWWLSGLLLWTAWILNVTVIGIPLGIKIINKVPYAISLRKRRKSEIITFDGNQVSFSTQSPKQYSLLVRAVYFVLVGWWLSGIWMTIAWFASVTIIGLPVAIWMYNRLPFVVSLYRFE